MTSVSKYNAAFYHDRDATTRHAAVSILGLVRERLPFCSVADLGCGVGTWLEVALELGAKTAFGWEGDWVESDMMVDNRIAFTTHNLELPLPPTEPVDLAISLEVAEHLSPARAESFVSDLCCLAPVVLFSAAMPGQTGGVGHVNMQWQDWWAERFLAHGYHPLDILRPKIWHDELIPVWYRQNALLYVSEAAGDLYADAFSMEGLQILDVVHPAILAKHMAAPSKELHSVGLRKRLTLAAGIPSAAFYAIRRKLLSN